MFVITLAFHNCFSLLTFTNGISKFQLCIHILILVKSVVSPLLKCRLSMKLLSDLEYKYGPFMADFTIILSHDILGNNLFIWKVLLQVDPTFIKLVHDLHVWKTMWYLCPWILFDPGYRILFWVLYNGVLE